MVKVLVYIDTNTPPHPTSIADVIIAVFVCLLECSLACTAIWVYATKRKDHEPDRIFAGANALKCIGAGMHILSTFVSNAHMYSVPWMELIRNVHCTLWDFWGMYLCGFTVWYIGMILHQLYWISVLEETKNLDGDGTITEGTNVEPASQTSAPKKNVQVNAVYKFRTNPRAEYQRKAILQRYTLAGVVLVVSVIINLVIELTPSTSFNSKYDSCYASTTTKVSLLLFMFTAMAFLLIMMAALNRRTANIQYLRHRVGSDNLIKILIVSFVSLILLAFLNMTGLLVYSLPRCFYMLVLSFMYGFSIFYPLYTDKRVSNAVDDAIESECEKLTYETVITRYKALAKIVFEYVVSSKQKDLFYKTPKDRMDIKRSKWKMQVRNFFLNLEFVETPSLNYGEILHDSKTNNDLNVFVIESSDDEMEVSLSQDEDSGCENSWDKGFEQGISLHDISSEGGHSLSIDRITSNRDFLSRRMVVQYIRDTACITEWAGLFSVTKQADKMKVCMPILFEYFPYQTEGMISIESVQSIVPSTNNPSAAELRLGAQAPQSSTFTNIKTCEAPPRPSVVSGSNMCDPEQLFRWNEVITNQMLVHGGSTTSSSVSGQGMPLGTIKKLFPGEIRKKHLLPIHSEDLALVYGIVFDENGYKRVQEVIDFMLFIRNVCHSIVNRFYFRACCQNSSLLKEYEKILLSLG